MTGVHCILFFCYVPLKYLLNVDKSLLKECCELDVAPERYVSEYLPFAGKLIIVSAFSYKTYGPVASLITYLDFIVKF